METVVIGDQLYKPKTREWAKQVATWLCITTLFPLATWYATAAFYPPPDYDAKQEALDKYPMSDEPKNDPGKTEFRNARDKIEKDYKEAEKGFNRRMFWVTYPLGILAVLIGLVIPVQSVGAGLMFGGICALSAGCYSAWDDIGRWAHFWSLIVALLGVIVAGLWYFGRHSNSVAIRTMSTG